MWFDTLLVKCVFRFAVELWLVVAVIALYLFAGGWLEASKLFA